MSSVKSKEIRTENLILRPFSEADAEQCFANWQKDPQVYTYLEEEPFIDVEQSRRYLQQRTPYYGIPYFFDWAIVEAKTNEVIGEFNASYSHKQKRVSIGYVLGSRYWNRGYMKEVLKRMILFFRDEAEITLIEAESHRDNPAARTLLEQNGFQIIGYHPGKRQYIYRYKVK